MSALPQGPRPPAAGELGDGARGAAPLPSAAAPPPRAPALKKYQRIVDAASLPPGSERRRLHAALRQLFPSRFASDTAAKKAARRGEVLVDGEKGGTEMEVGPGAVIEVGGLQARVGRAACVRDPSVRGPRARRADCVCGLAA